MIWNYELNEINNGYKETEKEYCCVMCEEKYEKGRVYEDRKLLYDAKGAINKHIKSSHNNVANYLLKQEPAVTGLTDIQNQLLQCILDGKSDKEIGSELGIAQSTVRNHRFRLREKEKQAKLFLALMESITNVTSTTIEKSDTGTIEEIHESATMVDDRYNISDREREKTIATYMDGNGALKQFPAKEKKKIILLGEIIKNFKKNVVYSEKEINEKLQRIYEEDYPTIRRALIEYGFMDRSKDCTRYRVN